MKTTLRALLVALSTVGCSPSNIDAVTTVALGEAGVVPTTPMDASTDVRTVPGSAGLHTHGTQVVDKDGKPFVIRAVTWYGLDQDFFPHGLSFLKIDAILQRMHDLGFNTIRVTWSSETLDPATKTQSINYTINPDLLGATPRQILDAIVDHAEALHLKIILSRRSASGGAATSLWYDAKYGQDAFFRDWADLATHYLGRSTIIGCDLESDLRGMASWGDGNTNTDWKAAAEKAGNQILALNPDLLIFVEGVDTVGTTSYWKGGNLQGVKAAKVALTLPDRLVYATQDFTPSFIDPPAKLAPWFMDASYPANLPGVWDSYWGFVFKQGIAPVFIAGFGTAYADTDTSDKQWLSQLTAYIQANDLGFAYYALDQETATGIYQNYASSQLNDPLVAALRPILQP